MTAALRALLLRCTLAACLAGLAGAAGATGLDALLERIAAAYGDPTPPASIVQRGRTLSRAQGEGSLVRAYRAPDVFRIEIDYPANPELRILSGPQAWQRNRPMSEAFRGALVLQAARVALPWNLFAARDALRDAGEHKFGEGRLHFIELPLGEGLKLIAEVDPDSGRILRSRGILQHGNSEMVFGTIYEDFRSSAGRLHAAVEHHFAMNRYIGRSHIDSVEYGRPLPDSLFRPEVPGMI